MVESTTLREEFADLKARAEANSRGDLAAEETARYQSAGSHLADAATKARRATELLNALKASSIPATSLPDCLNDGRTVAEALSANLSYEGHEFEEFAMNVSQSVSNIARDVEYGVSLSLSGWRDEQPAPAEEFLDVLDAVSAADVRRVRKVVQAFEALQTNVSDPAEIERQAALAAELRDAYDGLVSELPAAVRAFLERVPSGVGLDEVDASVLDWIRANDAGASFTVRLKK